MKNAVSLFLIVTLNFGCGLLKHSKNAAKTDAQGVVQASEEINPDASPNPTPSLAVLTLNNQSTQNREWISRRGEKFIAIAEVKPEELSFITQQRYESLIPAGKVKATWMKQTYAHHIADETPTPSKTTENQSYPEIQAYFAQTSESENFLVVIPEQQAGEFASQNDPTEVLYDDQIVCVKALVNITINGLEPNTLPFSISDIPATCDAFECTYVPLAYTGTVVHKTFDDIMREYPTSHCVQSASLPTKRVNLNNTATISEYQIQLNSQFETFAASVQFNAAAEN